MSVDGGDEVEKEDDEENDLEENGVDVEAGGHCYGGGEAGGVWETFVCGAEDVWAHSSSMET